MIRLSEMRQNLSDSVGGDEARMDRVIHVGRTRDARIIATYENVEALKDWLMLQRGLPLTEAEQTIGKRRVLPLGKQKRLPNPGNV